jgi:hypothetical protein
MVAGRETCRLEAAMRDWGVPQSNAPSHFGNATDGGTADILR